ncbi:hypothetical protein FXE62_17695 [Vibrio cholerae]|nr:hypothetical protein FXE62_17695 [Vibrio cholerae]
MKYFTFLDSYRILWSIKIFLYHLVLHSFPLLHSHNARLRGWQRITTKLKHNNCNHRSSMGLETPRVDSPS